MVKKLLIILLSIHCIIVNAQDDRPNIILFVMDDMGWQDTSVPFWKEKTAKNSRFNTPSMERLVASGTKFTHAYVTPSDRATQLSLHTAVCTARQRPSYLKNATSLTKLLKRANYTTIRCSGAEPVEGIVTDFDFDLSSKELTLKELTLQAISQLDGVVVDKKQFFLNFHATAKDSMVYYGKYRDAGLRVNDAKYASAIESMDSSLGEIMDYLECNNLAQNTTIIFISDCGGRSVNTGRYGVNNTQNYPLHAGKGSVYEGGVRVPMIVKSQMNPALKECVVPIQATDIMPTILELSRVKRTRVRQHMDGRSFVPVIRSGGNRTRGFTRSIYWHSLQNQDANPSMGYGATSSVVSGYWKLIYYYASGKTELFNLRDDIFEISNQAVNKSVSHIRQRLANDLTRHLRAKRAEIPVGATYPNGSQHHR